MCRCLIDFLFFDYHHQVDCLNIYYDRGMTGISKQVLPMIARAAEDAGLSTVQVKVS